MKVPFLVAISVAVVYSLLQESNQDVLSVATVEKANRVHFRLLVRTGMCRALMILMK